MNTNTLNPEARFHAGPPFGTGSRRTALRAVQGSVVAGVAAGLARYLGVDVVIIRLAFVVLTIVGGAGIPLYLAGLLLIPETAAASPSPVRSSSPRGPGRGSRNWSQARQARAPDAAVRSQASTETAMGR